MNLPVLLDNQYNRLWLMPFVRPDFNHYAALDILTVEMLRRYWEVAK